MGAGLTPLFEWVQTVTPEQLPEAPFQLCPGVTVLDREGFLNAIKRDALDGNKSPRARYGALQYDCQLIEALVDKGQAC